ncbi:MAG: hypothetical protein KDN19_06940 [Verrucomicrobiae bacterium]|nr:hypothetical protein [Verrucomicrobiae bacterium]
MSRPRIALPDEKRGWTLRSGRGVVSEGRELEEIAASGSEVIVGVPATLCTTFAVKLPTADASLFPAMVASQIEKRGLAHHGDASATPHSFFLIEDSDHEALLSVDVLSEDFPEALCLPRAAGYAPSARLLKLPEDRLVLWREHKRLVLAVNRHGQLSHVQVLSAEPTLNSSAAQEINLTTLSLQAEGLLTDSPELLVTGKLADTAKGERSEFETKLLMPAEFSGEMPAANAFATDDGFLPAAVRAARQRRSLGRRRSLFAMVALAVYLVAGTFIWRHAQATEAEISQLESEVESTRPEVAAIQESEARWRELEPAFDLHYYPVVQLNEITRAMPGSGVVIREYETRGRQITVRGRARDVQMAFRLKEDLEGNDFFRAYSWNMPQPKVERDNTVTFQIQGQPKHEGTDN